MRIVRRLIHKLETCPCSRTPKYAPCEKYAYGVWVYANPITNKNYETKDEKKT